jgi:TPR repeat protein
MFFFYRKKLRLVQYFLIIFSSSIDWNKALEYYRRILRENCDGSDKCSEMDAGYCDINADCEPNYIIMARIAEIYMEGKNGVEKNPSDAADLFTEAAEKAIQFGKGRLANKYYELAELVRSEE